MEIYEIIENICPLPRPSIDRLVGCLTLEEHPKGSRILERGRIERKVFFIGRGVVRAFIPVDGRDITFWIGLEGATAVSLRSYVNGEPGYETVECVEHTVVYALERDALETLFRQDIHIANWGRKFAEREFLQAEEKFIPLLCTRAAERYEALLKRQPELLLRLPLEHLASYLGITAVSLSRIRAKINRTDRADAAPDPGALHSR